MKQTNLKAIHQSIHPFLPGVFDLLHQAAFRDTLGRSLYAPEHMVGHFSPEQLLHYMKGYFSAGRLALVGVGVDHCELMEQAKHFVPFCSADIACDKAKYSGGRSLRSPVAMGCAGYCMLAAAFKKKIFYILY